MSTTQPRPRRRFARILLPALLVCEIVLVWSHVLPLRIALVYSGLVEAVLAVFVVVKVVRAVRAFRRTRAGGVIGWAAAQEALSEVIPARAARVLLYEPRMLVCLLRWMSGRHSAGAPGSFGYHRGRKLLFLTLVVVTVFDAGVTHLVLLWIFGDRAWVWVVLGLDGYTAIWVLGFYAGTVVLPHRLDATALRLRSGYLSELVVPRVAVRRARRISAGPGKNGKVVVDEKTGAGSYLCGDPTVELDLDPDATLLFRDEPVPQRISTLRITVDEPADLVAALTDRAPASSVAGGS